MKLSEAKSVADYAIHWPVSTPFDVYRSGAEYNIIIGIVGAFVPGVPMAILQFFVGWMFAVAAYARSK